MNEFQTKDKCEALRLSNNDKFMQEIKDIKADVSETKATLNELTQIIQVHIAVEEKGAVIMKWLIWIWFWIIIPLLWIIWNNLNDKIEDIHSSIKKHDKEITEIRIETNELKNEAEAHKEQDKKYYK